MMKQDGKAILKNVLLFGLILAIAHLSLSMFTDYLCIGKSNMESATYFANEFWLWIIIRIGILFWALRILTRKLETFHFGKLVVNALGIVILDYHMFYAYDVLDYYVLHEPPPEVGSDALSRILSLMQYRPKPEYVPAQYFLLPLTDILFYIRYGEFKVLLLVLFSSTITLPLWVSVLVFFIFRNKDRNKKISDENSLIDK